MPRRTTRRRTPLTSLERAARSSSRRNDSTSVAPSKSCSRIPSGSREWATPCVPLPVRTRPTSSPRRCSLLQPLAGRRLWFVGIGGAGMSALATVAKEWGAEVAGSDRSPSAYVELLEAHGVPVTIGHAAENVPEGWEVVASTAISPDNPETLSGARRRAELL